MSGVTLKQLEKIWATDPVKRLWIGVLRKVAGSKVMTVAEWEAQVKKLGNQKAL
jgi:hypothetical protein